jgi:hypothetical protein
MLTNVVLLIVSSDEEAKDVTCFNDEDEDKMPVMIKRDI